MLSNSIAIASKPQPLTQMRTEPAGAAPALVMQFTDLRSPKSDACFVPSEMLQRIPTASRSHAIPEVI